MLTVTHLLIIGHISVFAVTFCDLLTKPRMVFGQYGAWLDRLETNERWGWIAYPIGYCAKCTAGQIALWVFVYRAAIGWDPLTLAFVRGAVFVCLAVLVSEIISKALIRIQRG